MAGRTRSMTDMLADIRRRSDTVNQTDRFPDVDLREYANQSIATLWDELVRARGQSYYQKSSTLTLTPPVAPADATYSMPTDFYQLLAVYWLSGGEKIPLTPFEQHERVGVDLDYEDCFPRYRLAGQIATDGALIEFDPVPSSTQSVKVYYVPTALRYAANGSGDATGFDGINGWEMYVVWDVASQVIGEEERDPSFALAQLARITSRIQGLAPHRDAGGVERVVDWRVQTDVDRSRRARGTW